MLHHLLFLLRDYRNRMCGKVVLWVPGVDHAGKRIVLPTPAFVDAALATKVRCLSVCLKVSSLVNQFSASRVERVATGGVA